MLQRALAIRFRFVLGATAQMRANMPAPLRRKSHWCRNNGTEVAPSLGSDSGISICDCPAPQGGREPTAFAAADPPKTVNLRSYRGGSLPAPALDPIRDSAPR